MDEVKRILIEFRAINTLKKSCDLCGFMDTKSYSVTWLYPARNAFSVEKIETIIDGYYCDSCAKVRMEELHHDHQ